MNDPGLIARQPDPENGLAPAPAAGSAARRVWGMVYRHLCLFRSSWPRLVQLAYWPTVQMCIWGVFSSFMRGNSGWVAQAAGVLIGGVLLWDVLFRGQLGLSLSFFEEMWSRNLVNLFVSPLRPWEFVASMVVMSVIRTVAGLVPAALLAVPLFGYWLGDLGWALPVFFALLMAMGWSIALVVVALVLRKGMGAEELAWAIIFGLAPLSCVYYPVSALPGWVQPVALALPSTHVFEGMRSVMFAGHLPLDRLAWAVGLDLLYVVAGAVTFVLIFRAARRRGQLLTIGE